MNIAADKQATVAHKLLEQLEAWEIKHVFGVIGDSIAPLVEAVSQSNQIRYTGFRHEEAAAFAASAYAKLTGQLGVCLADAGPGAVHLINGAYDAYHDSVPFLALTGQSPEPYLHTAYHQTTNQNSLFSSATTYSATVADPKQALTVLREAMHTAYAAQTAVHLAIPRDLQQLPLNEAVDAPPRGAKPPFHVRPVLDEQTVNEMAQMLKSSVHPLILFGRSARSYAPELLQLARKLSAPMVHTLPAAGVFPHDEPLLLGVLGDAGIPVTRTAMDESDVILVLGSSWWPEGYTPGNAAVLQIDISPQRIAGRMKPQIALIADARDALPQLLERLAQGPSQKAEKWCQYIQQTHKKWLAAVKEARDQAQGQEIHPVNVMEVLSKYVPEDALITLDVGEHTLWFGAAFKAKSQEVVLSGMWRSMGYAVPAALAGRIISPQRPVIAIAGDGGFSMSMAEIMTSVQHRLPIVVAVMNNSRLAQEEHVQKAMGLQPVGVELHNPDFAEIARTMGAEGITVFQEDELGAALQKSFNSNKTTVIDIRTRVAAPPELARKIRQTVQV